MAFAPLRTTEHPARWKFLDEMRFARRRTWWTPYAKVYIPSEGGKSEDGASLPCGATNRDTCGIEAARFGVIGPGRVAGLASGDAGDQNVARIGARESF